MLLALIISEVSCTKNPDNYTITEDPVYHRRDSITLTLINSIQEDSIKSTVHWLQEMGTRFALSENNRKVAFSIKKKFIGTGLTDTHIDSFQVTINWRNNIYVQWQYNVIAHLHGTEYSDSLSVIGAHYDNILSSGDPYVFVPGADDNASGVAAVLEIARVMVKNNYSPWGSINFIAFGAEEEGLHGSASYAAKSLITGENIIMMLNNDMIAYEPDFRIPYWDVNIINYDNSFSLLKLAKNLCLQYTSLISVNDNTDYQRSDSYSLYLKGFKALYFASRKKNPYYHTINDISTNCNFEYCREVAKISCALLVLKN